MSRFVKYAYGYRIVNDIDDMLNTDSIIFGIETPDYMKIFNTDSDRAKMLAKHLIIDLFQLVAKDIFINFNQFNVPFQMWSNKKGFVGYWSINVFTDEKPLNPITNEKDSYPVLTDGIIHKFIIKPVLQWRRIVKDNSVKGLAYFAHVRIRTTGKLTKKLTLK